MSFGAPTWPPTIADENGIGTADMAVTDSQHGMATTFGVRRKDWQQSIALTAHEAGGDNETQHYGASCGEMGGNSSKSDARIERSASVNSAGMLWWLPTSRVRLQGLVWPVLLEGLTILGKGCGGRLKRQAPRRVRGGHAGNPMIEKMLNG